MKSYLNMLEGFLRVRYLSSPLLYYFVKKIKPGMQFPTKKYHDICIEAYPSSANSFFFVILKNLFPDLKIAHHSHAVASLKVAIKNKIPIFVVIRNPLDAISSRISRFNDKIEICLLEYICFYDFVLKNLNSIKVFAFDDITNQIFNVLLYISKELNLNFNYSQNEVDGHIKNAFIEINDHYVKRGRAEVAAIPRAKRKNEKEEFEKIIKEHSLYKEAILIYEKVYNKKVNIHNEAN